MIVSTRRLFNRLLPAMGINAVCDVGSMNGAEALAFRASVPRASVYAFEANPVNMRPMHADARFAERDIQLVPMAATDSDGEGEFFVVKADPADGEHWRGMSSLYERPKHAELLTRVPVKTTRLDTFFADKLSPGLRLALWIDVEGKSYEVIDGALGVSSNVHLLHVEVETSPCIAPHQRLYPDVLRLLVSRGFVELATDAPATREQFNALFVRRDLPAVSRARIRSYRAAARLRFLAATTVRKLTRSPR